MRILTVGDSWTKGVGSTDLKTKSWPAQFASKYNVEVVNLAQYGSSNARAVRIAIEELCRDSDYDLVVWPIGPANRNEILSQGKWQQAWPNHITYGVESSDLDHFFFKHWHKFNDVQYVLYQSFQLLSATKFFGVNCYICSLSFFVNQYQKEISWIRDYKGDNNFDALGMPLDELDIGISDLNRKLLVLQSLLKTIEQHQPDLFYPIVDLYYDNLETEQKYGYNYKELSRKDGHPDDQGYQAIADYFGKKLL